MASGRPSLPTNRYVAFVLIAVTGCASDLLTKAWMFQISPPDFGRRKIWWLVENFVGIETTLNFGALFGMGQGRASLFAALSILAAIGIVYWLFFIGAAVDKLLTCALGAVTGGIFGNLYDRLGFGFQDPAGQPLYAVRDWILFCYYDQYTWPNFNIADCLLVCGAGLLCYHAIFCTDLRERNA